MQRDSIDFGTMDITKLFRKIFIPTLLGMVFSASISIADGIFVGRGIGSDALAAVNIVAPFFLVTTGIGLLFGSGASIVAAVHLSQKKEKAANINITQAFTISTTIMLILSALVLVFMDETAILLGSSDRLLPLVKEYMLYIIPALAFGMLMSIGLFVIRLDGSPVFAMLCNVLPALCNVFLDYLFVFPLEMGIKGAALATALAQVFGGIMILGYMLRFTKTVHFYAPKFSKKSILLTCRNVGYMVKLGASAMIGELAIACMTFTGNLVFMEYLGEDGVAAFGIACYSFPVVFMIGNAIAQSAQPIISFNYGAGNMQRVRRAFMLAFAMAVFFGIALALSGQIFNTGLVSLFLNDTTPAYGIAIYGIPFFSYGFFFFLLNLVFIGYYQSIEAFRSATVFTLFRGVVFMLCGFLFLPDVLGVEGIWLAVPFAELLTFVAICLYYTIGRIIVKWNICESKCITNG